jgi:hypothetical protein
LEGWKGEEEEWKGEEEEWKWLEKLKRVEE